MLNPRDEAFRAKIARLFPQPPGPSRPVEHHVVISTLTPNHLEDRFEVEFHRRRRWCSAQFGNQFAVSGIYDSIGERIATRFSFTTDVDAMLFRLRFDDP
jgi:hypothetical protein